MFKHKAYKIITNMINATLPKINVNSGDCRFNFHCHINSVNDALNNNQDRIAMCFYFDDGQPIIHFINVDENGVFTDNTLGRWSQTYNYHLIRYIEKESFFDVVKIFKSYRVELNKKLPWYITFFGDILF